MGLDIYVGSFTRYYAGDWELVAAKVARELGATFEVIRSPLEVAARFGYALFRRHALLSVTHRLPFLLDW